MGNHWYPAAFLSMRREDITSITEALGQVDAASKLLFFTRQHGALGNRTPAEAVAHGMLGTVLHVARGWVEG